MTRWMVVALLLAGCAAGGGGRDFTPEEEARRVAWNERSARLAAEDQARQSAERERLARDPRHQLELAKTRRESDLLDRALTNSPDYQAAIRRAATANVDGEAALAPNARARTGRARDAAIVAEEARLSDAVEQRRRTRLADQARSQRAAMDEQARAACINQGAQIDAATYNPRSLFNLEGAIAGRQAADRCWQAYLAGRPAP